MTGLPEKIIEGLQLGYHCAQIMMWMSMEMRDIKNPFILRSLGALQAGMSCRRVCGTLTGGVCVLSSYFNRQPGEREPAGYQEPAREFVAWFEETNGSLDCRELIGAEGQRMLQYCPGLMERSFEKVLALLEARGIDPTQ
ncbi:MAG: C-GCAxxG-C-C family protein [Treponema sp.]|nr:C-GCAxxG-C-C family protein [Treponema sp.]